MMLAFRSYVRRAIPILCATVVMIVFSPYPAVAHGPCHCLSPKAAAPGTTVQVPASYGAVEVLWNPNPRDLSNPALVGSRWARSFHSDRRTISLARQKKPGAISFELPQVPEGKYLVVIFDLSEGGPRHHYTWDTLTITRMSPLPSTGTGIHSLLTVSFMGISFGILLLVAARRRG